MTLDLFWFHEFHKIFLKTSDKRSYSSLSLKQTCSLNPDNEEEEMKKKKQDDTGLLFPLLFHEIKEHY